MDPGSWTDCKLYYFMVRFGRHYSSMLLVLMSLEKCFAVYFPLKSKTVCTVKTAKWVTCIVGVVLAAYNMNIFFLESHVIKLSGRDMCVYNFDSNIVLILNTASSVLYSFVPFILMFIINFAIVFKFMRAKCESKSTESTNQALGKAATRGAAMVVTVSVTFLILTTPTSVYGALYHVLDLKNNPIYRVCMNFAQYLNHSINGVLYCIVGSKFRNELLKLICGRKRSDDSSASHSVNTDVSTTGSSI